MTEVSRYVYEVANFLLRPNQPFVGTSAFAHKGGLHVNAVQKKGRHTSIFRLNRWETKGRY